MSKDDIGKMERITGAMAIESEAEGIYYFVHQEEKRIAIVGPLGLVILNAEQAAALTRELPEVLEVYDIR